MSRDFIERLYWACSDMELPLKDGLNLGELYERTEAVCRADQLFSEHMKGLQLQDPAQLSQLWMTASQLRVWPMSSRALSTVSAWV